METLQQFERVMDVKCGGCPRCSQTAEKIGETKRGHTLYMCPSCRTVFTAGDEK